MRPNVFFTQDEKNNENSVGNFISKCELVTCPGWTVGQPVGAVASNSI